MHSLKNMNFDLFLWVFKFCRKIYRVFDRQKEHESGLIQYRGSQAQNLIYKYLSEKQHGVMIAKFGTYELNALTVYCHQYRKELNIRELLKSGIKTFNLSDCLYNLSMNAGTFPSTEESAIKMCEEYRNYASSG